MCWHSPERESVAPELPSVVLALGNCLADEAQITPDTLRQALRASTFHGLALLVIPRSCSHLCPWKYGTERCARRRAGRFSLEVQNMKPLAQFWPYQ